MVRNTSIAKYINRIGSSGKGIYLFTILTGIVFAHPAKAEQDLSVMCDQAAQYAANETGVPLSVLQAITLNETGRNRNGAMRPWPWTVNMEGKGVWFDNEDDARAYVYKNYKKGARSFDIGCFQINYKWHGQAFASIEEMFDPNSNALYAANFLKKLFSEKGDWGLAAGAYHSRTPKYANRYQKRFEAFRHSLQENKSSQQLLVLAATTTIPSNPIPIVRINKYPLLQNINSNRTLGSLVPLNSEGTSRRQLVGGHSGG